MAGSTIVIGGGTTVVEIEVDEGINYVRSHLNTARASAKPFDECSFTSEGDRVVINVDKVLYAYGTPPTRGGKAEE